MRLRLDIAYDGTEFHGWAGQPGLRTVQEELEAWIPRVLRLAEPVTLTCAGRTDAGVHARGQVAHLDLPEPDDAERTVADLTYKLRNVLPPDVVVRRVSVAPPGFDARFSATSRRYTYTLCDRPAALDPLSRAHVVLHPRELDVEAMNAASVQLLGLADFAAFCKRREGAGTVRTLLDYTWRRLEGPDAHLLEGTVVADAFCHSMVRTLVGSLLRVGQGTRDEQWPARRLSQRSRNGEVVVAPAHPLTLEHVEYPADSQLAGRAALTRNVRNCGCPGEVNG